MSLFRRRPRVVEQWEAVIEIADGETLVVAAPTEEELMVLVDQELGSEQAEAAEDPVEVWV